MGCCVIVRCGKKLYEILGLVMYGNVWNDMAMCEMYGKVWNDMLMCGMVYNGII